MLYDWAPRATSQAYHFVICEIIIKMEVNNVQKGRNPSTRVERGVPLFCREHMNNRCHKSRQLHSVLDWALIGAQSPDICKSKLLNTIVSQHKWLARDTKLTISGLKMMSSSTIAKFNRYKSWMNMLIAFINFKPYHGSKFKLKASRTICEKLHEVIIESKINVLRLCDPLIS